MLLLRNYATLYITIKNYTSLLNPSQWYAQLCCAMHLNKEDEKGVYRGSGAGDGMLIRKSTQLHDSGFI